MTTRNLDALLAPQSVALVGASDKPGSLGAVVMDRVTKGGFTGAIHAVNPRYDAVAGHPCVPRLQDLPEPADLAVMVTPPSVVPSIVADASEAGTRAMVVITAGITADAKAKMLQTARGTLLRIMGPNCVGLQVPPIGLDASFAHKTAKPGNLALLSQSGAIVTAMIDWAEGEGVGFSVVASLGEMADVDVGDLLDHLAADPGTSAVVMYLEQVTNARKFMSAARLAARSKPVIAIKAGRSQSASMAAASHTGALAGMDAVYDAAFARAGVLRVDDMDDLFAAASALARLKPMTSDRIAILTNGGGAGVLAVDAIDKSSAQLATLSNETIATLNGLLPPTWSHANPVDIIGDADAARYQGALENLLADPGVNGVLVLNCPTALASSREAASAVAQTLTGTGATKPVMAAWLGGPTANDGAKPLRDAGVPLHRTPRSAIEAFDYLVRHHKAQRQLTRVPHAVPPALNPDRERAKAIIDKSVAEGPPILSEVDAKALLQAYGVPTVPSEVAHTPHQAADIARRLLRADEGVEAVVAKILSPDISHKSDVGGVRLNLSSPHEVRQATTAMMEQARELRPDAHIEGVVVQPMVRRPGAIELILGLAEDPIFGPVILFGAGGTAVEVVSDKALGLPPLDTLLAADLIDQTRVGRLLKGYRDIAPADLEAIGEALIALSHLAADFPQIAELDINPLLADAKGVVALDARVRVRPAAHVAPGGNPRLAIKPYPSGWERTLDAPSGAITLRPIRPEDALLFDALLARGPSEAGKRAFFGAFSNFDHDQIARVTQIDTARAMAFVALDPAGALLGVARYQADPDHTRAHMAVLLAPDGGAQDLPKTLITTLLQYAREDGLAEVTCTLGTDGTVLADALAALGFVRSSEHHLRLRFGVTAHTPGGTLIPAN